jgi:hypothetical protein
MKSRNWESRKLKSAMPELRFRFLLSRLRWSYGGLLYSGRRSFRAEAAAFCFLLLSWGASAGTYYVDYSTGSDANAGTSTNAAWQHHPYMTGWTGSYTHTAGDQFIFRGGVTWPSSCWRLTALAGGSSSGQDYYGISSNWFAGSSWTQPAFDGGAATNSVFWLQSRNFITIDNLHFTNFSCQVDNGLINCYIQTNIVVENCKFDHWVTNGATLDKITGIVGNGQQPFSPNNLITNCVFDGTAAGASSGMGVYSWNGIIRNCVSSNMSNGFLTGCGEVSGCTIGPINISFQTTAPIPHENAIESINSGPCYWFNNVIFGIAGGVCLHSAAISSPWFVWNNVVWNSVPTPVILGTSYGAENVWAWNNTICCSAGTGGSAINTEYSTVGVDAMNNHLIAVSGTGISLAAGSTSSITDDLPQVLGAAVSAGYTTNNLFQPISASSPTVGAGTNLSAFVSGFASISSNITVYASSNMAVDVWGNSRSASGAWDIGAYEFQSDAPAAPQALTIQGSFSGKVGVQ